MCGILALLNNDSHIPKEFISEQFEKGKKRGPEHSALCAVGIKAVFGFHRLAINGLNAISNQPITVGDITLICNGEIYNYRELYKMMEMVPGDVMTGSDCEVIIYMYKRYGIEQTLRLLDGVFAFALIDNNMSKDAKMYIARDPFGVRPLYFLTPVVDEQAATPGAAASAPVTVPAVAVAPGPAKRGRKPKNPPASVNASTSMSMSTSVGALTNAHTLTPMQHVKPRIYGFASEAKVLVPFVTHYPTLCQTVNHFPPGSYMELTQEFKVSPTWAITGQHKYHIEPAFSRTIDTVDLPLIINHIKQQFIAAIFKRCQVTSRPIACLLSGGLDSSIVAALVAEYHNRAGQHSLETYSIGMEGSEDLKYARMVAKHIDSNHTEIIVTEEEYIYCVPLVIRAIESYDTTTVRASIGNWLLGKYISETSQAKVIFNGDGADELAGGYLYMNEAPDAIEFDKECRRLLRDIHMYDVLRSDKSISSHGLEPRTPFLDRAMVQHYMSISPELRFHAKNEFPEKYLWRLAFAEESSVNEDGKALLPADIIWRRKEAFSDGVTGQARSLYQILGEHAEKSTGFKTDETSTAEQKWYKSIFDEAYPGMSHLVPYYWMPKYIAAKDASARTLSTYKSDLHDLTKQIPESELAEYEAEKRAAAAAAQAKAQAATLGQLPVSVPVQAQAKK